MTSAERDMLRGVLDVCEQTLALIQVRGTVHPNDAAMMLRVAVQVGQVRGQLEQKPATCEITITDPAAMTAAIH